MTSVLLERIRDIIPSPQERRPLPGVQATLEKSHLSDLLGELSADFSVQTARTVLEEGKKILMVIRWEGDDEDSLNQAIISVRQNAIAFIGNNNGPQYRRLDGDNIGNKELVEEYLAQTFTNPLKISKFHRSLN